MPRSAYHAKSVLGISSFNMTSTAHLGSPKSISQIHGQAKCFSHFSHCFPVFFSFCWWKLCKTPLGETGRSGSMHRCRKILGGWKAGRAGRLGFMIMAICNMLRQSLYAHMYACEYINLCISYFIHGQKTRTHTHTLTWRKRPWVEPSIDTEWYWLVILTCPYDCDEMKQMAGQFSKTQL